MQVIRNRTFTINETEYALFIKAPVVGMLSDSYTPNTLVWCLSQLGFGTTGDGSYIIISLSKYSAYVGHKRPLVHLGFIGRRSCYGIVDYNWALSALIAMSRGPTLLSITHSKRRSKQACYVTGSYDL